MANGAPNDGCEKRGRWARVGVCVEAWASLGRLSSDGGGGGEGVKVEMTVEVVVAGEGGRAGRT